MCIGVEAEGFQGLTLLPMDTKRDMCELSYFFLPILGQARWADI